MKDVAWIHCVDEKTRLFAGHTYSGDVYVAKVEPEERFKYAYWKACTNPEIEAQYWALNGKLIDRLKEEEEAERLERGWE